MAVDPAKINLKENLNSWEGFFSFIPTKVLQWVLTCECKIICLFTGNQFGKTDTIIMDYVFRVLGMHPQERKNITAEDHIRTFRFASHTLPGEKDGSEVRNTQYPALKRRLPTGLIERDITQRKTVVTVKGNGGDIQIEFVSYAQDSESMAGVQRRSIYLDEEPSRDFYEEQVPRLLAADGDIMFTFTPVPGSIGWEYDDLYENAKYIYRTEHVRARIKERYGLDLPEMEVTDSKKDIAVIMAATDDNPIYEELAKKKSIKEKRIITAKEYIDAMFEMYDDEDVIDARRYGLFRQLSGKIYKSFTKQTHVIKFDKYFPEGINPDFKHYRGIDYHQGNPWAVVWLSVSPQDEIFVWQDYAPDPKKMITYDISREIGKKSGELKYLLDLIDPLASETQVNTNFSTVDDLNRYFNDMRTEGVCNGGYWHTWDTKGTRGREEFSKRLKNSTKVGKPFNNKVMQDERAVYLPTIWISDNCRNLMEGMNAWRYEEWSSRDSQITKDQKDKPQMRWSHFPITVECLLKNPLITNAKWRFNTDVRRPRNYFARR